MNVQLEPGTYVLAVSGGVDSMALLELARQLPGVRLVVAHYDHGIRPDSPLDRQLVQDAARRHGLPFVYDEGDLGPRPSEAQARDARYAFLHHVRRAAGARALVTAHHQDDLLETAILNLVRGTGRRGLTSLRSHPTLHRPLLHLPKSDLIAYAKDQGLVWREDSTNQDTRYLRNYVRRHVVPKFSSQQRQQFLDHIHKSHTLHDKLETELTNHLHLHPGLSELDRHWFIMLPHAVAKEVLVTWLRRHQVQDISSAMLERLVIAAKTWAPGRTADIDKTHVLQIRKNLLALKVRER